MTKMIDLEFGGSKCDTLGCGFRDPSAICNAEYIGTPCPRCGSSLLTKEDFDSISALRSVIAALNKGCEDATKEGDPVKIRIDMDGSGAMR